MADFNSTDPEDFPLADEDIPDFVMEYLQSDQGHLDQDIPDHILEYIQTRAAALEKNRNQQVLIQFNHWPIININFF